MKLLNIVLYKITHFYEKYVNRIFTNEIFVFTITELFTKLALIINSVKNMDFTSFAAEYGS